MAKIVELIETHATRGIGVEGDPIYRVTQYWTREGDLLFETDAGWREAVDGARRSLLRHGYTVAASQLEQIEKDILAGELRKT